MKMNKYDFDYDEMTDEEIDELYRPLKMNSTKTLAPLLVYFILCEHSSEEHHLRQGEILEYLETEHELVIERKALSRVLHLLADADIGICNDRYEGSWHEGYRCA